MVSFSCRNANPSEFESIGQLMVSVYANLDGFPKESEQPAYYRMLAQVGSFVENPGTEILVAVNEKNDILGAVVFFSDMQFYGSGGTATQEKNAAGFRLLAVSDEARGLGIGKLLTNACIEKAKVKKRAQLIIHTTMAMLPAWRMYEKLGFERSVDLDFMQGQLPVFGFRLGLDSS
jgi:GNAT superfamily N-acetyltransferase